MIRMQRLRELVRNIRYIERIAKQNDMSFETTASLFVGVYEARLGRTVPFERVKKRLGL